MVKYCGLSRRQRINLRNRTERLSELLGWDSLGVYYTVARHMAVEEKYGRANASACPAVCDPSVCVRV